MSLFGLPPLPPRFDAALRDVHARDPKFREAAARALAWPGDEQRDDARVALSTLLSDEFGPIRALAAEGLGEIADADDLPILRTACEDPHAEVRASAILAAAHIDSAKAPWLEEHLQDEHPHVRIATLEALFRTRQEASVLAACDLLTHDGSDEVRAAAADTLGRLRGDFGIAATEAKEALCKALSDNLMVARSAALALALCNDGRGEAILIDALRDGSWRMAALEGAAELKTPESANAIAFVGERFFSSLMHKAAAGAALAKRGDDRAIPILQRVLRAWRPDGRDHALRTVAEYRLHDLAAEVLLLSHRRRGASPSAVRNALAALELGSDLEDFERRCAADLKKTHATGDDNVQTGKGEPAVPMNGSD